MGELYGIWIMSANHNLMGGWGQDCCSPEPRGRILIISISYNSVLSTEHMQGLSLSKTPDFLETEK